MSHQKSAHCLRENPVSRLVRVLGGACLSLHAAKQSHGVVALVVSVIRVVGGSHSRLDVNSGEGCPQRSTECGGNFSPD